MPEPTTRIVLVGIMGSGKTTIAPLLARALGWEHLDMDREIERRSGMRVADIFRERGEAAFRAEERAVAAQIGSRERLVVAAGGGAFAQADTRETLRRGSTVVWLRCDVDTVMARIPPDGSRPLAGSRETIAALSAARESSYRLADLAFDTARLSPEALARAIADAVFPGQPQGARRPIER